MLMVVTKVGANRWRAAGMDLDGRRPPDDEFTEEGAA